MPITTSRFSRSISERATSSMAYVLPTPGAAPKNTVSLPRLARACSSCTRRSSSSGSGREAAATRASFIAQPLVQSIQCQIQLEHVDDRLADHAQRAPGYVLVDQRLHLVGAQVARLGDTRDL